MDMSALFLNEINETKKNVQDNDLRNQQDAAKIVK